MTLAVVKLDDSLLSDQHCLSCMLYAAKKCLQRETEPPGKTVISLAVFRSAPQVICFRDTPVSLPIPAWEYLQTCYLVSRVIEVFAPKTPIR